MELEETILELRKQLDEIDSLLLHDPSNADILAIRSQLLEGLEVLSHATMSVSLHETDNKSSVMDNSQYHCRYNVGEKVWAPRLFDLCFDDGG